MVSNVNHFPTARQYRDEAELMTQEELKEELGKLSFTLETARTDGAANSPFVKDIQVQEAVFLAVYRYRHAIQVSLDWFKTLEDLTADKPAHPGQRIAICEVTNPNYQQPNNH